MDPVDEEIREQDEEGKLEDVVEREGGIGRSVVELRVSPHFGDEERHRQDGHDG